MPTSYLLTRNLILRGLGFLYINVFLILLFQGKALWGSAGLMPLKDSIPQFPSLFLLSKMDILLQALPVVGLLCGIALVLGFYNFFLLLIPWLIQLSYVNSVQVFYNFGWEMQILEFTFLCLFISFKQEPSKIIIWFMRWMLFRLMLGAGLIKLRGDACWWDLSCLVYHYETQPNPHPLSIFFHYQPEWLHKIGVLFNHFVEIIVPFFYFGPKNLRRSAGVITVFFQITLILSGNLAWLNWLTLLMTFCCFDDEFLNKFKIFKIFSKPNSLPPIKKWTQILIYGVSVLLLYLSIHPALNLIRKDQAMNTAYNPFYLVNSYGAFGSITKERYQIVISGTDDANPNENSYWQEYQFPCQPGDISRWPCLITPYHYHIDWQLWFSAMAPEIHEVWLVRLAVRLLENESTITHHFAKNPFKDQPPKFIKMDLYKYEFAEISDLPDYWWKRNFIKSYMPPISLETPQIQEFRIKNR
jgi:hypothetical protein